VFYRDVPFPGNRQSFEVRDGDASLASLRFGQYAAISATPGEHAFALAEGGDAEPLRLLAEPGQTCYGEGVIAKVDKVKRQRLNRVDAQCFDSTSFKLSPSAPELAGTGPQDPNPFE